MVLVQESANQLFGVVLFLLFVGIPAAEIALFIVVGGEIGAYQHLLKESREEAITRVEADAAAMGADAIVAMRMATSSITQGASEVLVYGTAVKLRPE